MLTRPTALVLVAAALVLGACGGEDDEGGQQGEAQPQQQAAKPKGSTLDCLDLSVLSPERATKPGNEPGPEEKPLLSEGAQSSTILGGDELGATVIEYPSVDAAGRAYDKARASKKLAGLGKDQIVLRNDVLFLDYSEDAHVQKIVRACIDRPDQPPPSG